MKKNILNGTGFVLLVCLIAALIVFSSAKIKASSSESKPCKESMQDCCQKAKDAENGDGIDFEILSGKFFSSLSY